MATISHCKDFASCCRTCLNDASNNMYDIFEENNDSMNTAEMLMHCTSISVKNEDTLPQKLCSNCYNCLVNFYGFRKRAEQIDIQLKYQVESKETGLDQHCQNGVGVEVKLEIDGSRLSADYDISEEDFETDNKVNCEYGETDNSNKYFCDICLCEFGNFSEYQEHCKVHNKCVEVNLDLKCNICNKNFKKITKLHQHVLKHATDNELHTCSICVETFRQNYNYVKHIEAHVMDAQKLSQTSEINQNDTDQIVECEVCSAHFKSMNALAAHKRKHTKKDRVLACSICGKIFKKVSHLKRHELCHDVNRPYKCSQCSKSFNTESLLTEHANKHKGIKPHVCPMCSKSFAHLSTLTSHIKIHTREKPFLCPTCGKKFDSSTNWNQHMKRHMGIKMFACNLCPTKFVSKGELKSHMTTHTGERTCTCEQCGTTFTKRSSLVKHELRHAGVKPHQCDVCAMKFTTKDHLKRHYRIHTGEKPYKCDICERAFTQSNDLVKHRRAHLGDKLYKCTECTEAFRLHSELRQHISAHFISSQLQAINETTKSEDKEFRDL